MEIINTACSHWTIVYAAKKAPRDKTQSFGFCPLLFLLGLFYSTAQVKLARLGSELLTHYDKSETSSEV